MCLFWNLIDMFNFSVLFDVLLSNFGAFVLLNTFFDFLLPEFRVPTIFSLVRVVIEWRVYIKSIFLNDSFIIFMHNLNLTFSISCSKLYKLGNHESHIYITALSCNSIHIILTRNFNYRKQNHRAYYNWKHDNSEILVFWKLDVLEIRLIF